MFLFLWHFFVWTFVWVYFGHNWSRCCLCLEFTLSGVILLEYSQYFFLQIHCQKWCLPRLIYCIDLLYKDNRASIIIQSVAQKTNKNNNEWTSEFEKKYCGSRFSYAGRVQKCIWISEQMSKTNAKHALETNRQRIQGDKQLTHTDQTNRVVGWAIAKFYFSFIYLFFNFNFGFWFAIFAPRALSTGSECRVFSVVPNGNN